MRRPARRRGTATVEGALVFLVFAVLIAGIMELGIAGFAGNAVTFAAASAARFAAVRGAGSRHPASVADVQAKAAEFASPLNSGNLSVTVTWSPDNQPGSSVEVTVAYVLGALMPISSTPLTLRSTARQMVTQ